MSRSVEWHTHRGDVIKFGVQPPYMMGDFMPGIPAGAAEVTVSVRTDGQSTHHVRAEPLMPTLTGSLNAQSQQEYDYLRRKLQGALNPKSPGTLIYNTEDGSYMLRCRPVNGAVFSEKTGRSCKIDIEWESDGPYWASKYATVLVIGRTIPMWVFPWAIKPTIFGRVNPKGVVNNTSDIDIWPLITVAGTRSSGIVIGNETTGESIAVERGIERGERLEVDMSGPSARLVDAAGRVADVTQWLSVGSDFPWACVPGRNVIYCDIDNPLLMPEITVTWHQLEVGL